jgi:hypothetical protein
LMACISCGVITSAWLCRIWSLWVSAIPACAGWSDSCFSGLHH